MSDWEPKHVRGLCDIADCDGVASRAYRDEEIDMYVEVCADHAQSLGGFDSDYERVEHDSPYREPDRVEKHDCGGELRVYPVESERCLGGAGEAGADNDPGSTSRGVHRVCVRCGYAVLVLHTGENEMTVKEALPEEKGKGKGKG